MKLIFVTHYEEVTYEITHHETYIPRTGEFVELEHYYGCVHKVMYKYNKSGIESVTVKLI